MTNQTRAVCVAWIEVIHSVQMLIITKPKLTITSVRCIFFSADRNLT